MQMPPVEFSQLIAETGSLPIFTENECANFFGTDLYFGPEFDNLLPSESDFAKLCVNPVEDLDYLNDIFELLDKSEDTSTSYELTQSECILSTATQEEERPVYTDLTKSNTISVLGINLNFTNEEVEIEKLLNDEDIDNVLDENVDSSDGKEFEQRFEDLLNESFDSNFFAEVSENIELGSPAPTTTDAVQIMTMFPHVTDEKNRRRRSLLYESSYRPNDAPKENFIIERKPAVRSYNRRPDALLNHDYTHKKAEDDKYFPCPVTNCEKIYAKSSHLKAHLRRHSGEKPFACNWQNCSWKFSRSDELARHKRSHSGIKPYKCELCEKSFARSDHLSKHRKVHRKKMAQYGTYIIKKRLKYD